MSNNKISTTSDKLSHANSRVLIDIDDVDVSFGSQTVLKDINVCLHAGEFVGLIGPNGAGKTTLLRVILGLQEPDTGQVTKSDTKVGYIPQKAYGRESTVPISASEVVGTAAGNDRRISTQMLKKVGMDSYANTTFSLLSGGQQQRVLIAKALAMQPDILVLDEPTTGIDEASQLEFFDTLQSLHKSGITILMVSHDVDTVLNLVQRVICLNQSIVYDGPSKHFEVDKYLPKVYGQQHRILHHHHKGQAHD